jgi:transposase
MPMGKKNWLFSWTELGARHVGIVQSLLATCRLHGIDRYDRCVDVLQRVGAHAASLAHQRMPRILAEVFAEHPRCSGLHFLVAEMLMLLRDRLPPAGT